jgi:menaquinone-dependent protoporphyrinogen oxidase
MIKMSVLVVYASKHGATRGIAGRIAASLRTAGCKADVRPVKDAGDLAAYDAFVIGSAAYELHWRKEATEFVRRNTKVLAARPVWLFSSGPLGTEPADAKGRDLRTVTVPKEIPEFTEALHPRGHHVFFGALDLRKLTFAERSLRKLPAVRAGSSRRRLPRLAGDR